MWDEVFPSKKNFSEISMKASKQAMNKFAPRIIPVLNF
jgi:hypothetical protein